MKIDVYKRTDGSVWADYAPGVARRDRRPIKSYEVSTRHEMESLVKSPGDVAPARVRALAERALSEHMARNQQPLPSPQEIEDGEAVRKRSFVGRLKWLVKGD